MANHDPKGGAPPRLDFSDEEDPELAVNAVGSDGEQLSPNAWICDACGAANGGDQFPCKQCGYPVDEVSSPIKREFFDGLTGQTFFNLGLNEKPRTPPPAWSCPECGLQSTSKEVCANCDFDPEELHPNAIAPQPFDDFLERQTSFQVEHMETVYQVGAFATSESPGFMFRVYAPNAKSIRVLGDFNCWKEETATPLQMESDLSHWSATVDNATSGQQYKFLVSFPQTKWSWAAKMDGVPEDELTWNHYSLDNQQIINHAVADGETLVQVHVSGQQHHIDLEAGTVRLGDDEGSDRGVVKSTKNLRTVYRNDPRATILAPAASPGAGKGLASVLIDHRLFQWTDQGFSPRSLKKTVLYELQVGSFKAPDAKTQARFVDVENSLEYLKMLGVTGIAFMPITQDAHPNSGEHFFCWGYDPLSLFAVDRNLGTPDELKSLINSCHSLGLSAILDLVPNHMHKDNVLQYWDGPENSFFFRDWTPWGPRPNFGHPGARAYILDAALYWIEHFHFDGVRVDSTPNIRKTDTAELPEGWALLQDLNDMLHTRFPNKFVFSIAEDLYNDPCLNLGGAGFDVQWDQHFFKAVFHAVTAHSDDKRDIRHLASALEQRMPGPVFGRLLFTENHDTVPGDREKRLPQAIAHWKSGLDLEQHFHSLKRSFIAGVLLLTSPGMPMVLQGQELFETQSLVWPEGPIVDWSRLDRKPGCFLLYQHLIALRKNTMLTTRGLTGDYVRVHHIHPNWPIFAFHRWHTGGPGDDVIVVVNLSHRVFDRYRIGVPRSGFWQERLNTDSKAFDESFQDMTNDSVEAEFGRRDGYVWNIALKINAYSAVVLSQNGMASLVFRASCYTHFGEQVFVCGSTEDLGCWNPQDGIPLVTGKADIEYPYWQSAPVPLTAGETIYFKVVVRSTTGQWHWERTATNHSYTPARTGVQVLTLDVGHVDR